MKPANSLLSNTGTTIFTVMSALAVRHKAINLGQGFPDTDGPADIVAAAAAALQDGRNQYPRSPACPSCARRSPPPMPASTALRSTPSARSS